MSNRLECEFPAHRWQAVPPIRRDPALHDVAAHYMARGRELRSAAFRRATHTVVVTVGRGLAQVVAFVRCAASGIAKQPPEHDCHGASARGA
jgi:hypothetical protein